MFKFHDSNFLTVPNFPDIKAGVVLKNGYGVAVANKTATAVGASAKEIFVVLNIIDKPEIKNTEDYQIEVGEYARTFNMMDLIGLEFDMSADLITGSAPNSTNKYLIPNGDGTWKAVPVASLVEDAPYFEVVKETKFGGRVIENKTGYLVVAKFNHATPTA